MQITHTDVFYFKMLSSHMSTDKVFLLCGNLRFGFSRDFMLTLVKTMSIEWLFRYFVLGKKVEIKLETILMFFVTVFLKHFQKCYEMLNVVFLK